MPNPSNKLACLGGAPVRRQAFPNEEPSIGQSEIEAARGVLASRQLSIFSNSVVSEFETAYADFIGTETAVAVTSGTAALHASLASLEAAPGSEVVVPVYTYAASVNSIYLAGLVPRFVDLERGSPNLSLEGTSSAINDSTVAILGVDLFGIPFDRDSVLGVAKASGIRVIEDAAQSSGATWSGQRVGSFDLGCHSFGEIKNMTTGEGGMVTTSDIGLAERIRAFRHAGEVWSSTRRTTIGEVSGTIDELTLGMRYAFAGQNYRMNALQAAIGLVQLSKLDLLNQRRNRIHAAVVASVESLEHVFSIAVPRPAQPIANRCVLLLGDGAPLSRRAILYALMREGIPAGVYYPKLHSSSGVGGRTPLAPDDTFPEASKFINRHFLVPCFPAMSDDDGEEVAAAVRKVFSADLSKHERDLIEEEAAEARVRYFGQFLFLIPSSKGE